MSVAGLQSLSQELDLQYPEFIRERVNFYGSRKSINLSNLGLTQLPKALEHIEDIYILNLANNDIMELPWYLDKLNLRRINLTNNSLKEFPEILYSCHMLKNLNLRQNDISKLTIHEDQLSQLENIDISSNNLNSTNFGIYHQSIRAIVANQNKFNKFPKLATPSLRHLELNYNEITEIKTEDVLQNLIVLELKFNRIEKISDEFIDLSKLIRLEVMITKMEILFPHTIKVMLSVPEVRIYCLNTDDFEKYVDKLKAFVRITDTSDKIQVKIENQTIHWRMKLR